MSRICRNTLELGIVDGKDVPLEMTPEMRSTHLYVCGTTGTGKSKILEHLIRRDIKQWPDTKCGALIIDPHGSLYDGVGEFDGTTGTESAGGAIRDGEEQEARIWNIANALSKGTSRTSMRGGGRSVSTVPYLKSIFGEEVASITSRSIDEQLFKAMVSLCDRQQRHGVARLVGMRAPLNIVTPIVQRWPTSKEMANSFLTRAYEKLPFALRSAEAHKQIEQRQKTILQALPSTAYEPVTARRGVLRENPTHLCSSGPAPNGGPDK